jgi:hypothetical protein
VPLPTESPVCLLEPLLLCLVLSWSKERVFW